MNDYEQTYKRVEFALSRKANKTKLLREIELSFMWNRINQEQFEFLTNLIKNEKEDTEV